MKVGYYGIDYPQQRMVINKCLNKDVEYIRIHRKTDLKFLLATILFKLNKKSKVLYESQLRTSFVFKPIRRVNVDVIHFFNITSFKNELWLSSYEAEFPVTSGIIEKKKREYINECANRIIKNNCIALLAMSKWAYDNTEELLKSNLSEDVFKKCMKKISVLEPPQNVLVKKEYIYDKYKQKDTIEFVFVGREFWRKGGYELVKVFDKYKNIGNIHLTIISSMSRASELRMLDNLYDEKETKDLINNNKNITWYDELENSKVIDIIKNSKVGLLPTYEDTYGFSVLEMQACGCPVITTNVNALKYVNNDERGWIIDMGEYSNTSKFDMFNRENLMVISKCIYTQLDLIIEDIINNPECVCNKAIKSLEYIKKEHSPERYSCVLSEIYKNGSSIVK